MLQEEIKLMLLSLIENKRKFREFYRKGYFEYLDNKDYKGSIAIVNNKAVISLLEDINDETKAVATVNFKDSGILIYKLLGQNYSFSQFGQDPFRVTSEIYNLRVHTKNKNEVIEDIETIRRHCIEAKENATSITGKIKQNLSKTNNRISDKGTLILLQDTIAKLSQSRHLNEKDDVSDIDR